MKTHWKKTIDPNWIGCYILPDGKPITVKLLSVKFEHVKVMGKSGESAVARFEKNQHFDKPMLLNSTNCKRLSKIIGSPYLEDWKNIDVTLQQEMDRAIGGGKDWALRISSQPPRTKTINDFPELKAELEKCETLEKLKEIYTAIDLEVRQILAPVKDKVKSKLMKEVKNDSK